MAEIGWSSLELEARRELWSLSLEEPDRRLLRADLRAGAWDAAGEVRARLRAFVRDAAESVGVTHVGGLVDPARPEEEITGALSFLLRDFGRIVPQNGRGDLTAVLRDQDGDGTTELGFHSDTCDLVVLLCLRPAFDGGGLTRLASARHVHDLIQRERPDALATLREDWTFDRTGRPGPQRVVTPILYDREDGTVGCYYQTRTVRSSPDRGGPELTDRQWEALGVLDEALYRPEIAFGLPMGPGDLLVIRNSRVLHGRSPFVDEPGRYARRMLRVWVNEGAEWAR
ncbi:TauD/TfdA family dioxygenase [Streptomyces sp. CBMA156]|uniref:TauD/TfdA family dioxygenase n=1 Tax=Streptomyces sp. CBMA156 TaxID=1930280 RepID=UPI0016619C26|nr:TauD/TfdA family dioxygenase [Streptomyces sp. CBMA156]MBD0676438.1 taurine catabolism dioxygenase TauD [Streptomyces sp. CBMA156]